MKNSSSTTFSVIRQLYKVKFVFGMTACQFEPWGFVVGKALGSIGLPVSGMVFVKVK